MTGHPSALASPDPTWVRACDLAIRTAAASGDVFQAHDLVTRWGLAEPSHHCQWGQRLHVAATRGLIVQVGAEPSTRPSVKGSLTRTWRGVREGSR